MRLDGWRDDLGDRPGVPSMSASCVHIVWTCLSPGQRLFPPQDVRMPASECRCPVAASGQAPVASCATSARAGAGC